VEGTDYVLDGAWLLSLNGCWPIDMPCAERRLIVSWRAGSPVSPLIAMGAAELATELCKACNADPTCRLPSHVTSVTRLGVTVTLADARHLTVAGYTGLPTVDLAIRTFNPNHIQQPSAVFSPDVPRPEYRWTGVPTP
jgi:hypothetical protein